jgi:hypothetical protein
MMNIPTRGNKPTLISHSLNNVMGFTITAKKTRIYCSAQKKNAVHTKRIGCNKTIVKWSRLLLLLEELQTV